MSVFRLTIHTDNDVFGQTDEQRDHEISNLLSVYASQILVRPICDTPGMSDAITDINGNRVGSAYIAHSAIAKATQPTKE